MHTTPSAGLETRLSWQKMMQLEMLGGSVTDDSGEQASDTIIEALFLAPLKFKNHGAEHQTSWGDTMD